MWRTAQSLTAGLVASPSATATDALYLIVELPLAFRGRAFVFPDGGRDISDGRLSMTDRGRQRMPARAAARRRARAQDGTWARIVLRQPGIRGACGKHGQSRGNDAEHDQS